MLYRKLSMLKIVLPGNPTAQARMRMWKRGNKTMMFDPQGALKHELKTQVYDQSKKNDFKYPRLLFWFYMPIPKSMDKKQRSEAETGLLKHSKKPDVDNLIKLYLDVLVGPVLPDDNCVSIGSAIKVYSINPRTVIYIQETDKILTDDEIYEGTWQI